LALKLKSIGKVILSFLNLKNPDKSYLKNYLLLNHIQVIRVDGLVNRSAKIYSAMLILPFLLLFIPQIAGAEEGTAIEITVTLSANECYPGDSFWVNGTALYDNSTPVRNSEVQLKIVGTEMKWKTKTDSNGTYQMQISALGRYMDQNQSVADTISGFTDNIRAGNRVGQSFKPNISEIKGIEIYVIKSSPSPDSILTAHLSNSSASTEDIGNATLNYEEVEDGWNYFAFSTPLEVISGDEYFIILSSNTTSGGYRNYGGPWEITYDYYENGTVHYEGNPMVPDAYQDIAFVTYYEELLPLGEFTVNVSISGENTTGPLYGFNEEAFTVIRRPIADLNLTESSVSLESVNYPPIEGEEIIITVGIWNQGDASADNFLVNFSLDLKSNVFQSDTITIDRFQQKTMITSWIGDAGEHTIIVTADSSELVLESLETNNIALVYVFVDGDFDMDGIGNVSDMDDDTDGYRDEHEIAEGTDFLNATSKPVDNDGDYLPDSMDQDNDNDGYDDVIEYLYETDPFDESSVPDDLDSDFIPDSMDSDLDGDGIQNELDVFPIDSSEWEDLDGDNIGNNADLDDDADGIPDSEDEYPLDTDNDGLANDIDWDDDSDGILDWEDANLLDTDNDGQKNDVDLDDDNDGLLDSEEKKAHTNPLKADTDGDGTNDKKDYDPLDFKVTSDPGFPIIYLVFPILAVVIIILVAFFVSRRGFGSRETSIPKGYEELPGLPEKSATPEGFPPSGVRFPRYDEAPKPPETNELKETVEEKERNDQANLK
jgi:hypothetical protein